jgi:hypothetical protein
MKFDGSITGKPASRRPLFIAGCQAAAIVSNPSKAIADNLDRRDFH